MVAHVKFEWFTRIPCLFEQSMVLFLIDCVKSEAQKNDGWRHPHTLAWSTNHSKLRGPSRTRPLCTTASDATITSLHTKTHRWHLWAHFHSYLSVPCRASYRTLLHTIRNHGGYQGAATALAGRPAAGE